MVEFAAFVRILAERVRVGMGVVIYCRAGIGRSGITAAAALVALGHDRTDVFDMISQARGLHVPDTQVQVEWFLENWQSFRP